MRRIMRQFQEIEVGLMTDSPHWTQAASHEHWGKGRDGVPNGWLARRGWKAVDRLYIWSAAAGLFVSLVLIAVDLAMHSGRLP